MCASLPGEMCISLEDNGATGRYVAKLPDFAGEAQLNYSRLKPDLIAVGHIGVPAKMKGRGVGTALANHVVQEARANGFGIIPLCSFLRAQYAKHPEWADVMRDPAARK